MSCDCSKGRVCAEHLGLLDAPDPGPIQLTTRREFSASFFISLLIGIPTMALAITTIVLVLR